jgi:membrane-associated phospholipid phosphatase
MRRMTLTFSFRFIRFEPMPFNLHRFANFISWVISPIVVAPVVYIIVVMLGYGSDVKKMSYLMVLFFSSTLAPVLLISGLKKVGKISDYNIPFREQRFLPLLVLIAVNALGYEFMKQLHPPRLLTGILLFNAVNTVFILLVTLQWKISIHLFTLSSSVALLFMQFGVVALWLLLLVPILMWSRIILKAHNLMQTFVGAIVGFVLMVAELQWWTGL